jgi:hypothetical protein
MIIATTMLVVQCRQSLAACAACWQHCALLAQHVMPASLDASPPQHTVVSMTFCNGQQRIMIEYNLHTEITGKPCIIIIIRLVTHE